VLTPLSLFASSALCTQRARYLGPEQSKKEALTSKATWSPPLSQQEAEQLAADEGLALVPTPARGKASTSRHGAKSAGSFKGVTKRGKGYSASVQEGGVAKYLGTYSSEAEAESTSASVRKQVRSSLTPLATRPVLTPLSLFASSALCTQRARYLGREQIEVSAH
jgi:hypothetical protein